MVVVCVDVDPFLDEVHPALPLKETPSKANTMMCRANFHGTLDQQTTSCNF